MTADSEPPLARTRRELAERRSSAPRTSTRNALSRHRLAGSPPAAPLRRNRARRVLRKLMTVGAMAGAAALLISTSLPASTLLQATSGSRASAATALVNATEPVQNLKVDAAATVAAPTRDACTVIPLVQQIATKYAAAARSTAYTNDPNGTIQWPFPVPVPIASGFGPRSVAGCGFCSTFHEGVDFTPGSGVAIQAIADGVVSKAEFDSSGASTGAHLHLEIHLNNTPVDPFAWLEAKAN